MKKIFFLLTLLILLPIAIGITVDGPNNFYTRLYNIFYNLTPRITQDYIFFGGVKQDNIPAIDDPKFVSIQNSIFDNNEIIIGVNHENISKAYPFSILYWHEIVNDVIGSMPIAVTLCPLCNTTPVFKREIDNKITSFGVSGKLFQSCLIMYDRNTETLWSQAWGLGISGKKSNTVLTRVPAVITTLDKWRKKHPDSLILSDKTGYNRSYNTYPYGFYRTDNFIAFPVRNIDQLSEHPKNIISYIYKHDSNKPINKFSGYSSFASHNKIKNLQYKQLKLQFGPDIVTAKWDAELDAIRFYNNNDTEIPSNTAFEFVYPAYFN